MFSLILALGSTTVRAQDFKPYPDSRIDESASSLASNPGRGLVCRVFTSADSFEKVYAFYKDLYKEFPTPYPMQKLPNGQPVKWAFFIIDGAVDLAHSRNWVKVQRPYIGTLGDSDADFKDIRDVSVIQNVRRQPAHRIDRETGMF
jgi:hypothetical protein